jgi:type IV fimbrial biogenesis protein FimT
MEQVMEQLIGLDRRKSFRGFTLTEMLIAVSVIAILTTSAAPSYRSLILNQHVRTVASDLHTSLFFARGEAIKRAASVDVIPTSADWTQGWSVRLHDAPQTVLRNEAAVDSQLSAMSGSTITYDSDGRVRAPAPSAIIARVSGNTDVTARCVVLDLSGRASVILDTDRNPDNGCN